MLNDNLVYTTKEEKWCYFKQLATAKLLKGQEIDINCHYIQLVVDPTFSNKFVLQFEILNSYVNWYCTTWKSELDRLKIYTALLEKEIPEPTLFVETGRVSKEAFQHVLDLIAKVSICPYIDEDWGDYRDGEIYSLIVGYKGCITKYKWHYLPEKWSELKTITNALLDLYGKLGTIR